jgi:hypothetical protein
MLSKPLAVLVVMGKDKVLANKMSHVRQMHVDEWLFVGYPI